MYTSFFGLQGKPFEVSIDPRYLYIGPNHRKVLASLVYGIQEKKGVVVVTGEVGTGKTSLVHTLLGHLDSSVKTAFVPSPLPFHNLLPYMLSEFGLDVGTATITECLRHLRQFLLAQHTKQTTPVLIIDEAQDLPWKALESIRLLSNLEADATKLLQIVLVGQPELQLKLHTPELRQLRQRIGVMGQIQPLAYAETQRYIAHRFTVAGGETRTMFTPGALKAIHAYAGGIPRQINTVCNNALLKAYAERRKRINRKIIRRVVRDTEPRFHRSFHGWAVYAERGVVSGTGRLSECPIAGVGADLAE